MPVPRIFVSSTCYDLQEIRYNLRDFIKGFNYEPVMSEFGDIFFDYKQHVQDSCINEIKKCQMYVLIIGNNYGSVYYKQESNSRSQDSITLKEFKESLELQLPKHIFINRFVNYDYATASDTYGGLNQVSTVIKEEVEYKLKIKNLPTDTKDYM